MYIISGTGTVTEESSDYFAARYWALKKSKDCYAPKYWAMKKVMLLLLDSGTR
jgi:hypothetical protein